MAAKRNNAKTFDRLWDALTEIALRATKLNDKKLNQDAGRAMRLLDKLGKELEIEKKQRGTIQIVC